MYLNYLRIQNQNPEFYIIRTKIYNFSNCFKLMLTKYQKKNIQDISCVFQCVSGKGSIFISNYQTAANLTTIQKYQIGAIISITLNGYIEKRQTNIGYLYIPAPDHSSYQISEHFQQTFDFIDKQRKHKNVLVHCQSGISRSATIVAAYLLKKYRYSLDRVLSLMKRRRPKINPNNGFMDQLQNLSRELGLWNKDYEYKKKYSLSCICLIDKKRQKIQEIQEISSIEVKKRPQEHSVHSTTQSIEKQRKQQREITEKLQKLRRNVIKANKIRSVKHRKYFKEELSLRQSNFSEILSKSQKQDFQYIKNKSTNCP